MQETFNSKEAAAIAGIEPETLRDLRNAEYFGKEMARAKDDDVLYALEELAVIDVIKVALPFCGPEFMKPVIRQARRANRRGDAGRYRKILTILVVEKVVEDQAADVKTQWLEPDKAVVSTPNKLVVNMELLWTNVIQRAKDRERTELQRRLKELE